MKALGQEYCHEKCKVSDTRDRFNYGLRFLRELSVHSVSRGNESCGAVRPDAHVCVGVIDRAHGAFGIFTAAITPTVFHSAYLWLSLINDTVVLTPLKYRGDHGISRPRVHHAAILITACASRRMPARTRNDCVIPRGNRRNKRCVIKRIFLTPACTCVSMIRE